MAPRTTTNQASQATLVADAISSLQKVVGNALASAEDQGRTEVGRANAEATDARRERDDALKQLNNAKMQCKEWERRGEVWKGSMEKSEMTIKHQTETITQLREEASQWKNQLLRFEETSRREVQDWKEQYLRAEQERFRLSARLDQLIAEQLEWSGHGGGHRLLYTPRAGNPDVAGPSDTYQSSLQKSLTKQSRTGTATTTTRPRKSKAAKSVADSATDRERTYVDLPTPKATNARTPKRKMAGEASSSSSAALRKTPAHVINRASTSHRELSPPHIPESQLIRRVKAVIEVPVKEEEYSDYEGLESGGSGSEYVPNKQKLSSRRSSSKGKRRERDEEPEEESDHDDEGESEDDDQLLIGSGDDADEQYGTKRVSGTHRLSSKHSRTSTSVPRHPGSAKKRKLDTDSITAQKTQNKIPRKH